MQLSDGGQCLKFVPTLRTSKRVKTQSKWQGCVKKCSPEKVLMRQISTQGTSQQS